MVRRMAKRTIQKALSLAGYKLTRLEPAHAQLDQSDKSRLYHELRVKWLHSMGINTVIDVGAHHGDTALMFHQALPHAQICAFEPLPDSFSKLISRMSGIPKFKAFCVALGEQDSKQVLYRSEFAPSSSLLRMKPLHKTLFPRTAGTTTELVEVRRLDSIVEELVLEPDILLKMDVQGFEDRVLRGASNTLKNVAVVVAEVMFQPLYEEQAQFSDIYDILREYGFAFRGVWNERRKSPINGLPMYSDLIFVKGEIGSDSR